MRLRNFVNLCVAVAVALFVLIPESHAVALFVWEGYIFGAPDEYTEADGTVVLTEYALNVSPLAWALAPQSADAPVAAIDVPGRQGATNSLDACRRSNRV